MKPDQSETSSMHFDQSETWDDNKKAETCRMQEVSLMILDHAIRLRSSEREGERVGERERERKRE